MSEFWIYLGSGLGLIFILLAGIGLLKMPDFYIRLSISTKAVTLGVGLILVACAASFGDAAVSARVVAIILFIVLTAPVGAHMIGRASYFTGIPLWEKSKYDDIKGKYNEQSHVLRSHDVNDQTLEAQGESSGSEDI